MSKTLQCILCHDRFDEKVIKDLKFFPSTLICSKCYRDAQTDEDMCFGKKNEYESDSILCTKVCPDRKVCKLFIKLKRLGE